MYYMLTRFLSKFLLKLKLRVQIMLFVCLVYKEEKLVWTAEKLAHYTSLGFLLLFRFQCVFLLL
jgi:hypothetical protein